MNTDPHRRQKAAIAMTTSYIVNQKNLQQNNHKFSALSAATHNCEKVAAFEQSAKLGKLTKLLYQANVKMY